RFGWKGPIFRVLRSRGPRCLGVRHEAISLVALEFEIGPGTPPCKRLASRRPPGVVTYPRQPIPYISGRGTPDARPLSPPCPRTTLSHGSDPPRLRAGHGAAGGGGPASRRGGGLALVHDRAGPRAAHRRRAQRGLRRHRLARPAIRAGSP